MSTAKKSTAKNLPVTQVQQIPNVIVPGRVVKKNAVKKKTVKKKSPVKRALKKTKKPTSNVALTGGNSAVAKLARSGKSLPELQTLYPETWNEKMYKDSRIFFKSQKEFNKLAADVKNIGKVLVPSSKMKKKGFMPVSVQPSRKDNNILQQQEKFVPSLPTPVYFINGDRVDENVGKEALAKIKPSQPYVLRIRNASNNSVDVVLFNPDYCHQDILIETGYPHMVTYKEMLRQFIASPFTVGQTYVVLMDLGGREIAVTKMLRHITVHTKDANCTSLSIPLIICKDPYQMQNAIAIIDQEFRVDTLTYLEFVMPPLTTLEICLYPSDNVNLGRMLANKNAVRDFGNPKIIKA